MESKLVKDFLNEIIPKIRYIWFRNFVILEHTQAKERAITFIKQNREDDSLSQAYRDDVQLFDEIIGALKNSKSHEEFIENPYSVYVSLENHFANQESLYLGISDADRVFFNEEANEEIKRERHNNNIAVSFLKTGPKIHMLESEKSIKNLQLIELEKKKQ